MARALAVDMSMSAPQVLEWMGPPDHISQERCQPADPHSSRMVETWEFDYQLPSGWQTLTVTWDHYDGKPRLKALKRDASPWLQSPYRVRGSMKIC